MAGYRVKMNGQSVVEYLLLLTIVAILVLAAMRPGGIVDDLQNKALDYYNAGAQKIRPTPAR